MSDNRTILPKLVKLCTIGDITEVLAFLSEKPPAVAMYLVSAITDELHALIEDEDPQGIVLEAFLDALADQDGVDSYVI